MKSNKSPSLRVFQTMSPSQCSGYHVDDPIEAKMRHRVFKPEEPPRDETVVPQGKAPNPSMNWKLRDLKFQTLEEYEQSQKKSEVDQTFHHSTHAQTTRRNLLMKRSLNSQGKNQQAAKSSNVSVLQNLYHLDQAKEDDKSPNEKGWPTVKPFTARTSDKFLRDNDNDAGAPADGNGFVGLDQDRGRTQVEHNEFKRLNPNVSADHLHLSVNTSNKSIANDLGPLRSEREIFQQSTPSIDYKNMRVVSIRDYKKGDTGPAPHEKQTMFGYRKKNSFGRMSFANSNSEAQLA